MTLFHLLGALSSGALATAAFPDIDQGWLAWFALVPLFFSVYRLKGFERFQLGLAAGLCHYLSLMYWLVHTMHTYGELPLWQSIPVFFLLTFVLALYWGVAAAALPRLASGPLGLMAAVPALWIAFELARTFIFSGFPWGLIAYTQYRNLALIQVVDIFGVYGLGFLIVGVNSFVFLALLKVLGRSWRGRPVPAMQLTIGAVVILALIAGAVGYGQLRLQQFEALSTNSPRLRVSVVQGNIDQAVKWNPAFKRATVDTYLRLSAQAAARGADLVVWPESAMPFYFTHDMRLSKAVTQAVDRLGRPHLIGSPYFSGPEPHFYNRAFLLDADGRVSGTYDKAHLVPFGEYVPMKKWLPFLGKMVAQVGDFQSGPRGRTLEMGATTLGPLICYESIFPLLSRLQVRNGADVLVNMTNDAWYGRTSAPRQLFVISLFRAVENKRSLVRAANTGISGFVDPVGRIQETTPIFTEAVSTADVTLMREQTLYTRFGDVFAFFCGGVMIALAVFAGWRRLR